MSRPLRIEFPDAWYHVMNRGRRGADIFSGPDDFEYFIHLLLQSVELWDVRVSSYCLMSNHYHLLIQTPLGNLSRFMRHLNGVYTQYYNRSHDCDGALFRGRYKSILVEEDSYLLELVRYIHRNPLRAGIVEAIENYTWCSHPGYLSSAKKWDWLHKDFILNMLTSDRKNRLKSYRKFIDLEDSEKITDIFDMLKFPVILGRDDFIDWVKTTFFEDKVHEQIPDSEQLAPEAERIRTGVCQYYGVGSVSLMRSRRGVSNEPRNVAIYMTRLLRKDGLLTISSSFGMRGYSSASSVIERVSKQLSADKEFRRRISEIKQLIVSQKESSGDLTLRF